MEDKDLLLSCLFARVKHHQEPEDNPVLVADLADDRHLPLEQTMSLSQELYEDGFLTISSLHLPPLVYISLIGIARAKRLEREFLACTHS